MTIIEHLEELRRVLMISVGAWVVATIGAFFFHDRLLTLLEKPLTDVLGKGRHIATVPIVTTPTEPLTIPLKVSAIAGFAIALPIILWQVWTFVSPGLRQAERKFAWPFIVSAVLLFGVGACFAYFVMPVGLNFLAGFLGTNAEFLPDLNAYLTFFTLLIVIFGVTFELPIAILLLGLLGIVSSRWLRTRRKGIWVGIVFVALVVTPGADPFTPTALFLPLIILFEASIVVLDKVLKR
ncbi:MAG TPA: twin-arginine translocase subunit TatC [Candidatus Dormibacteraeota bacterium]|jgi:sec-independent protein translocase protein TatC|nr:twin-arginine translocase subunit TatC [Candidatus Dormibacteraeota bacterium]